MWFPLQASIQVVLGSVWVPVSPVVWFFQCVFLMCDVFPFASIDSGCFGFRVGVPVSPVVWFFQCVLLMCDAFPFASIDSGCFGFRVGSSLSCSLIFSSAFSWCVMCFPLQALIQVVLGSVWVPVSPVVWFFRCVYLMCDVVPFASIDSGCFGFRVGSSLSCSLIFPVRFLDVWCASLCKHRFRLFWVPCGFQSLL